MKPMYPSPIVIFFLALFLSGCGSVQEFSKTLWGSSTRALDNARTDALTKTFQCSFNECYDAVLQLANDAERQKSYKFNNWAPFNLENPSAIEDAVEPRTFDIFLNDRFKGVLVVMGLEGNVNTTEVGIFFTRLKPNETKIEISSLSTSAKIKVADMIFPVLSKSKGEASASAGK